MFHFSVGYIITLVLGESYYFLKNSAERQCQKSCADFNFVGVLKSQRKHNCSSIKKGGPALYLIKK